MIVAAATQKMIEFYRGNLRDIDHFLKVWAMAKTIGELEGLDSHTQEVLELTAVVHDIACPLCREKYGNTNGSNQELESPPLVETFFEGLPVDPADFLVNAGESGYSRAVIEKFRQRVFRTKSGIRLLDSMYLGEAEKD